MDSGRTFTIDIHWTRLPGWTAPSSTTCNPTPETSPADLFSCLLDDTLDALIPCRRLLIDLIDYLTLFTCPPIKTLDSLVRRRRLLIDAVDPHLSANRGPRSSRTLPPAANRHCRLFHPLPWAMAYEAATLLQLVCLIAWTCLTDTPFKQKYTFFAQLFPSQEVFDATASAASLIFCRGLWDVLQAATPPALRFFKDLPSPDISSAELRDKWGVYVIVMEKPGYRPKVYIGSGTSAEQGCRQRLQQYENGTNLPQYIAEALEDGYEITHKGLLCWIARPTAVLVPIYRLLFIILEATFAYIFWTMRTFKGTYGMLHICLWDRNASY